MYFIVFFFVFFVGGWSKNASDQFRCSYPLDEFLFNFVNEKKNSLTETGYLLLLVFGITSIFTFFKRQFLKITITFFNCSKHYIIY